MIDTTSENSVQVVVSDNWKLSKYIVLYSDDQKQKFLNDVNELREVIPINFRKKFKKHMEDKNCILSPTTLNKFLSTGFTEEKYSKKIILLNEIEWLLTYFNKTELQNFYSLFCQKGEFDCPRRFLILISRFLKSIEPRGIESEHIMSLKSIGGLGH